MSRTALTIKASCCYIIALGLALVVAPNLVLAALRMPASSDVWIRVLGVVVINIGVFFWVAARTEAVALFHASVIVRPLALLWFGAFVLLGFAGPMLLLFGVIEVAGALWTWSALHSDRKAGQPAHPASRIDPKYESRI